MAVEDKNVNDFMCDNVSGTVTLGRLAFYQVKYESSSFVVSGHVVKNYLILN